MEKHNVQGSSNYKLRITNYEGLSLFTFHLLSTIHCLYPWTKVFVEVAFNAAVI